METFVIGDLRLIARFNESFPALDDQFSGAAAKHGLLAEQIGFGLFRERRFEHAAARAADAVCVGEGVLVRAARRVLINRDQRWDAAALFVLATHETARALRSDEDDVQVLARTDLLEVNVEAVREEQSRAF